MFVVHNPTECCFFDDPNQRAGQRVGAINPIRAPKNGPEPSPDVEDNKVDLLPNSRGNKRPENNLNVFMIRKFQTLHSARFDSKKQHLPVILRQDPGRVLQWGISRGIGVLNVKNLFLFYRFHDILLGMKQLLGKALDSFGLREAFWDTALYDFFCGSVRLRAEKRKAVDFFKDFISKGNVKTDLWFDIGANIGSRTSLFLRLSKRVLSVEPDPENLRILQRRFRFSRRVQLMPVALGAREGIVNLYQGGAFSTVSTKERDLLQRREGFMGGRLQKEASIPVKQQTLDSLIGSLGRPDFIKIDVEGYEKEVIAGLSVPVHALSFEANLSEFADETFQAVRHLDRLSRYQFNFVLTDPPAGFFSKKWLAAHQLIDLLKQKAFSYCEVFCYTQEV